MPTVQIKPLSVNEAYYFKKVKTAKYRTYCVALKALLPDLEIPKGPLKLQILVGFSSKLSDVDNPLKPFIDVLQARYGFNDRNVFDLNIRKCIVKKGSEFITFEITSYDPTTECSCPHCKVWQHFQRRSLYTV